MDQPESRQKKIALILLCGLILVHVAMVVAWFALDDTYTGGDSSSHYFVSLVYYNRLVTKFLPDHIIKYTNYYPPLIYLMAVVAYLLLGIHYLVLIAIIFGFFIGSIIVMYMIGKRAGPYQGVAMAAIWSFVPYNMIHGRQALLEMPVAFFMTLTLWFLIRSDLFDSRKDSILLGLALGLGALAKWLSLFFTGPAMALVALYALGKRRDIKTALNIFITLLVFLATAGWWYFLVRASIAEQYSINAVDMQSYRHIPETFTLGSFLYYPSRIFWQSAGAVISLLAVIGLFKGKYRGLASTFLLVGLLVMWLVPNKSPRFIVPLFVPLAMLAGNGLFVLMGAINGARGKKVLASAFVVFLLLVGVETNFGLHRAFADSEKAPTVKAFSMIVPVNADEAQWVGAWPYPGKAQYDFQGAHHAVVERYPMKEGDVKILLLGVGYAYQRDQFEAMNEMEIAQGRPYRLRMAFAQEIHNEQDLKDIDFILYNHHYGTPEDFSTEPDLGTLDRMTYEFGTKRKEKYADFVQVKTIPGPYDPSYKMSVYENRRSAAKKKLGLQRGFFIRKNMPNFDLVIDAKMEGLTFVGASFKRLSDDRLYGRFGWYVETTPPIQYIASFCFEAEGERFCKERKPLAGLYPMPDWQVGEYVVDELTFNIPKEFQNKELEASIWLFEGQPEWAKMQVADKDKTNGDNEIIIGSIPIE